MWRLRAAACTVCTMCGSGRFETCRGAYTGATVVVEVHRLALPGLREFGWKRSSNCRPRRRSARSRFEEIVGEACESAAGSQVARRFHLPETTVRAIDLRYLERWDQRRPGSQHWNRWEWTKSTGERAISF